jgi:hypothetical protein
MGSIYELYFQLYLSFGISPTVLKHKGWPKEILHILKSLCKKGLWLSLRKGLELWNNVVMLHVELHMLIFYLSKYLIRTSSKMNSIDLWLKPDLIPDLGMVHLPVFSRYIDKAFG